MLIINIGKAGGVFLCASSYALYVENIWAQSKTGQQIYPEYQSSSHLTSLLCSGAPVEVYSGYKYLRQF